MGKRLLAALDGQPSECQAPHCEGVGWYWGDAVGDHVTDNRYTCNACRGTGHNLAGVLPPIEWSPVVRRRAIDGYRVSGLLAARIRQPSQDMQRSIIDAGIQILTATSQPARLADTRSVPRGQHRALESADMAAAIGRCFPRRPPRADSRAWLWTPRTQIGEAELRDALAREMDAIFTGAPADPPTALGKTSRRAPRWWYAEEKQHERRAVARWSIDFPTLLQSADLDGAAGVTFARLGHAAQGDGADCPACGGRGHISGDICDECFGRGRRSVG